MSATDAALPITAWKGAMAVLARPVGAATDRPVRAL